MSEPKLNFIHLCDMAFLSQEKKLNIIGIFEHIYAHKFPITQQKMTVVANMSFPKPGKYPFSIEVLSTRKTEPLIKFQGEIDSQEAKNVNLIADFPQVGLPDQGDYLVKIEIEKKQLAEVPFKVTLLPIKK